MGGSADALVLYYPYVCMDKWYDIPSIISQEYLVEYENAAEEFRLEGNDIELFRINSFSGTKLTQNQGIRDFPTLVYYRDDETITYRGPLTSTHI